MDLLIDPDPDPLDSLEQRIRIAAERVMQYKREKEAAEKERLEAIRDASHWREQAARLTEENEALRAEKELVRKRIGKLLEQIDALNAG